MIPAIEVNTCGTALDGVTDRARCNRHKHANVNQIFYIGNVIMVCEGPPDMSRMHHVSAHCNMT